MSGRGRLDQWLVERGLAPSRSRARAWIEGGRVRVDGSVVTKPSHAVEPESDVAVDAPAAFASRGGDKLDAALDELGVELRGAVCLDVGASTGGFTDCLLTRGARKVYAVDVGHGQLLERLRRDPRVVTREHVNARHLDAADFDEPVGLIVVDASFISLEKLLPALQRVAPARSRVVALVKPQFEIGKAEARRTRGVVRDPRLREEALQRVRDAFTTAGFRILGDCPSRLPGAKGNVEHFLYAERIEASD